MGKVKKAHSPRLPDDMLTRPAIGENRKKAKPKDADAKTQEMPKEIPPENKLYPNLNEITEIEDEMEDEIYEMEDEIYETEDETYEMEMDSNQILQDNLPINTRRRIGNRKVKARVKQHYDLSNNKKLEAPCLKTSTWLIFIVLFIVLCILRYSIDRSMVALESNVANDLDMIKQDLAKNFPELTNYTLKVTSQLVKKIFFADTEPSEPGKLLIIVPKGAEENASRFSHHLARLISFDNNYSVINGSKNKRDPDVIKEEIDNLIDEALGYRSETVILIEDLDRIPADAALMFHGYFDEENAKYKKAFYIMTISVTHISSENFDKIAIDHLKDQWHDLKADKLEPFITRIVGNPVTYEYINKLYT